MNATRKTRRTIILTCLTWLAMSAHSLLLAEDAPPDIIIVDGKIWSGAARPLEPEPTALAITHNKITAVGDDKSIRRLAGEQTTVISIAGRRVIPGITDAHTHLLGGGFQLKRISLRDAKDQREFVARVRAAAAATPRGEWVLGGRWSVDSWADPTPPSKAWIDKATGDTPALLSRMDGHQALANSAALQRAGIDKNGPPDPPGGEIERNQQSGEPTGILKESAANLVSDLIPPPTASARRAALMRAMHHANALGITAVHDMTDPQDLATLLAAHRNNALTLRITSYPQFEDWNRGIEEIKRFPVRGPMLAIAGLKGYMDGSLGSRTAYMRDRYADATDQTPYPRGQLTAFAENDTLFRTNIAAVHDAAFQVAIHAIGDQANHLLLNAYESIGQGQPARQARHRIEHAQHLRPSDIARFKKLGVIASMQPLHKADDGRYAETAIGKARLDGSYAYRRLVDSGALLIFGSDWPVVSLNPFEGMDSAVNARTLSGNPWLASHSLSREETLCAYTRSPNEAIQRDSILGTLEVGKLADLVILQQDLLLIPKDQIGKVQVYMTMVDGRIVHGP